MKADPVRQHPLPQPFFGRSGLSLLTKIASAWLFTLICPSVWAVSQPLSKLSRSSLDALFIATTVLMLSFLIIIGWLFYRLTIKKRLLAVKEQQNHGIQQQLDRCLNAIIQLDTAHHVLYANREAAYFLAKNTESIMAKPLVEVLPSALTARLNQALAQQQESHIYCQLGHHQRHCRIRIAPQKTPVGEIATFVLIEDIEYYQQQIDSQAQFMLELEHAVHHAGIGLCCLNLSSGELTANTTLASLLQWDNGQSHHLDDLKQCISSHDQPSWATLIKQLQAGQDAVFTGTLTLAQDAVPVQIAAHPHKGEKDEEVLIATLLVSNLTQVEQLKHRSKHYRQQVNALLSSAPYPIYLLDQHQRILDCNRHVTRLFNLELTKIKNKPISQIEGLDTQFKQMHANLDAIGVKQQSERITVADQLSLDIKLHTLSYQVAPQQTEYVAIIEDLTQLHELQEKFGVLRDSVNRLLAQAPLGIALFDEQDNITLANTKLADLLGRSENILQQQSFYQLLQSPQQAAELARLLQQNKHIDNFVAELATENDQAVDSRLSITKVTGLDGQYLCWITDSRQEQYIRHQFSQLLAYSQMPVGILVNKQFCHLNPAACHFFGVDNDAELIGLSPANEILNSSTKQAAKMSTYLAKVTNDKAVMQFSWEYQHKGVSLPCEVILVPLLQQQEHKATLCLWSDLRAIAQANADRLEAVNLHQVAEREIAEKQQLLENSQDLLASKARSLQDSREKLQVAEQDLASKIATIAGLQQQNEDISDNLALLQQDYQRNRALLKQSQQVNTELENQLEQTCGKVTLLQQQRDSISQELKASERSFHHAQQQLAISGQTTQKLQQEQAEQRQLLQASQQQIDALKHSIASKDKQLAEVSGKISTLQSQLVSSSQSSDKLKQQLANQRKASASAEQKRRQLALSYQRAQAELLSRNDHVEHLQHEMNMLEQMSLQQKGNMQKQTQQLAEELAAKQQQLELTAQQLAQAKQQAEQEKQQNNQQQAHLQQLQQELQEMEQHSVEQQEKIAATDSRWQQQQQALQAELAAKQNELQQTTAQLNSRQQQSEEEKVEQTALLKQLEAELQDVMARAAAQQQQIALSDQQWQQQQQKLAHELAAKKAQLQSTKQQLDQHQRLMEAENLSRQAQEDKLTQLQQELTDVQSRANKQQQMIAGNDEQWRQHLAEIEGQKQQLHQALHQAEAQNKQMQAKLQSKLTSLQDAESAVSKTQSDEQALQQELAAAKQQARSLQQKLILQEDQQHQLKRQVNQQQDSLQQREDDISTLQTEQQKLTGALDAVKQDYAQSKIRLQEQNASQQQLSNQLQNLEAELKASKQQLTVKEHELEQAQQQIANSAGKLAAHEQALVKAQKDELKQAKQQNKKPTPRPEYAMLEMPDEPEIWFDLMPYLQHQQGVTSLASTLTELMDNLLATTNALDKAIADNNDRDIQISAGKLAVLLQSIHSAPLNDMAKRLQLCCDNQLSDNIAISWPASKRNLMTTLRVIYSHLDTHSDA